MLELQDNPPMCLPSVGNVADLQGDWWVAYTKARFEKQLAFDLLHRKIGFYLPMTRRVTFSGGRKRCGMAPLFTSYVFFCGNELTRYEVLSTDRVCQAIPVRERTKFVA